MNRILKASALVFGIFLSSAALAGIAPLGSSSTFKGVASKGGLSRDYTVKMTVATSSADPAKLVILNEVQYGTNPASLIEGPFDPSDERNQDLAGLESLIANCSARGGTSTSVTVEAGTFDTCLVTLSGSSFTAQIWLAAVAGGEAKGRFEYINGEVYDYELTDYSW